MADVAVVIPAYNPGDRLQVALDSVLAQRDVDLDVVVVDDGGEEDLSWIDALPVRRHRQVNAGVSVARNVGVAMTSAPLVAFLDQDDSWHPTKIRTQLDAIGTAVLCHTDFRWMPSGSEARHPYPLTRRSLLDGGHFCLSSLLVRRDALDAVGGFGAEWPMEQDWDLAIRLLSLPGASAAMVSEVLVDYWVHESNASKDYRRVLAERLAILRREHRDSGDSVRHGIRDTRRVAGAQAWDAFRGSRSPGDASRAFRNAPIGTVKQAVAALRR